MMHAKPSYELLEGPTLLFCNKDVDITGDKNCFPGTIMSYFILYCYSVQ